MNDCIISFNGERRDPASGETHLGSGYRAYNPVLMRFHSPDSLSPFAEGGINPCSYCGSDPINRTDPSGHHSVAGWAGIFIGVALSILLTPVSGGSSLAVALSIASVATAAVSTGLAIAQQFVEASDPKTGAALGWMALGVGVVSAASTIALSRAAPRAEPLVSLLRGNSNRPFGGFMMTGGSTVSSSGGQFRNAEFIGVYPSVEQPGNLLAFSFQDGPVGDERLTIVGQPAITPQRNFALGSGRWVNGHYNRTLLGVKKINSIIRESLENHRNIKRIRLAIPYSSHIIGSPQPSFTTRVRSLLSRDFSLTVSGPHESFEVRGEAVEKLRRLQNSLHLNPHHQLVTYHEMVFSPEIAQIALNQLSEEYAERTGAFEIIGGSWH